MRIILIQQFNRRCVYVYDIAYSVVLPNVVPNNSYHWNQTLRKMSRYNSGISFVD